MAPRTIFLGRLIGLFALILALSMLADKPDAVALFMAVAQDRTMLFVLGLIGTAAGLALVLGHQIWSGGALPVLVTVVGWIILIRGVAMLSLSAAATARLLDWLHFADGFYLYMSLPAALGLYLTVRAFAARPGR
ncbi:MAG TPA: hypothetical protein VMB81_27630 [Candidatus Sulfotelmatobacter sp.]|nr:hypothetical protein [Candidatus Sulfotelmatobacter sp.]